MVFFSEMQFGFQEGVGCTEASFTIIETTCWSVVAKFSAAFSVFEKPLTQFGLTGFFTNYFYNLESKVGCGWP